MGNELSKKKETRSTYLYCNLGHKYEISFIVHLCWRFDVLQIAGDRKKLVNLCRLAACPLRCFQEQSGDKRDWESREQREARGTGKNKERHMGEPGRAARVREARGTGKNKERHMGRAARVWIHKEQKSKRLLTFPLDLLWAAAMYFNRFVDAKTWT